MKKRFYVIFLILLFGSDSFAQSNWIFKEPKPTSNNLNSVFFIDDNNGWMAGDAGTILKISDASGNFVFTQQYITSDNLNSIFFYFSKHRMDCRKQWKNI